MAGKDARRKTRKNTNVDKLRRKLPASNLKVLDSAAIIAASRRSDYRDLEHHKKNLKDFIQKATEDYKVIDKHMKTIEDNEFNKLIQQVDRPKWSWWY